MGLQPGRRGGGGPARAWAAALLLAAAAPVAAQGLAGAPFGDVARGWAPLRPIAAAPRRLPAPLAGPSLLLGPVPRAGTFWTAGNPAGLAREVEESWTAFSARQATADGDYRRPLDPVRRTNRRLEALSWTPVGEWGAAAGRVRTADTRLHPGSHANTVAPYRGVPWVVTDTALDDMRRVRARLEGALGVRLGAWSVGVGGGYRTTTNRTRESGLAHFGDRATASATVGAERRLAPGLRAGAYLRGQTRVEEISLNVVARPGRVHLLQGYAEPRRVDLTSSNPSYFRRSERDAWLAGVSVGGREGGWQWAAFAERGRATEVQTPQARATAADSVFDRWAPEATRVGLGLRRRLSKGALLTADLRWSEREGEARVPAVAEPVYREETTAADLRAGLRLRPGPGWRLGASAGLRRESRRRVDRVTGRTSDLDLWQQRLGLQAVRRVTGRLSVGAGYGLAYHDATGGIPRPSLFEGALARLVRPELLLYARPAWAHRGRLGARYRASGEADVWLEGRLGSLSPSPSGGVRIRGGPGGSRTEWSLTLGVILR